MRRCPNCKLRKSADRFTCDWCDDCIAKATDKIMTAIGYTIAFCNQQLYDDAQERWEEGWQQTMALPKDYPDYAALCATLSQVCPIPEDSF